MEAKLIWQIMIVVSVMAISVSTSGNITESIPSTPMTSSTTESPLDENGKIQFSIERWQAAEKRLRKLISGVVKYAMPQIVMSQEDLQLSSECSRGMLKFMIGFKQMKKWAFQMFDSFGKLPNGMSSGSINTFGDYDLCVDTVAPKPGRFQGQYCLLEFSPSLPPRRPFVSYDETIMELKNLSHSDSIVADFMKKARYFYNFKFRSSICMPSTCTKSEIVKIVSKVARTAGLDLFITLPNCEVKVDQIILSTSEIVIIVVLASLVLLAVTATVTDVYLKMISQDQAYQKGLSIQMKCLMCFSFYTNGKRLLKKDDNPDSIKIFHGMKVITILWVILNHTYLYLNFQAMNGLLNARETGREYGFQLVINGFINVQTFFFISAVLVSYGVTKMKGKNINIFLYAFRRFWRLTPPFMFVIACIYLLPHLGSGPVWKETVVDGLTAKCRNYWWANLLYFNNFISKKNMCIDWTWYIPVDTHLYFLSLLVLIPLKRNVKLAFFINAALLVAGIIATATSQIYYKLQPTAIYVYSHPDDINYWVDRGYYRSYLHIFSYNVGLTVGYLLATRQKIHISKTVNIVGWLAAFVLSLSIVYGVYEWNQGHVPGLFVGTLYACTNKLVWALSLAWVTISCMSGNGGFATTILSWNGFVPLGRLTYMVYLVHPIVQFVYIGSTRTLIRSEHRTLLFMYCSNVVLGFLLACACSLLFESPFMALEKVFFSSVLKKENSERKQEKSIEMSDTETLKFKSNFLNNDLKDQSIYTINFKQLAYEC